MHSVDVRLDPSSCYCSSCLQHWQDPPSRDSGREWTQQANSTDQKISTTDMGWKTAESIQCLIP